MSQHPQLLFIRRALSEVESLRDAAKCNGPQERHLASFLSVACIALDLALSDVLEPRKKKGRPPST